MAHIACIHASRIADFSIGVGERMSHRTGRRRHRIWARHRSGHRRRIRVRHRTRIRAGHWIRTGIGPWHRSRHRPWHWTGHRRPAERAYIVLAHVAVPSASTAWERTMTQIARIDSRAIAVIIAGEHERMSGLAVGDWIRMRLVLIGTRVADVPFAEAAIVSALAAVLGHLAKVAVEHSSHIAH